MLIIAEAMVGGIRRHVLQIVRHADRDRFDLTLLCSVSRDPSFEPELDDLRAGGLAVIQEPMARSIRPLRDFRNYRRILRNLLARPYDVVHTHGSKAGMLGRYAAHRYCLQREHGCYVVHTGHTFPIQWATGLEGRFYRALEQRAASWTDRIIALTQAQKRMLIERKVCEPGKITVLPNAVELPPLPSIQQRLEARGKLGLPPDAPVAAMVGRIVEQKHPLLFAQTAAAAMRRRPELHFVWLGDGPLRHAMEREAQRLGVPPSHLLVTGQRSDVPGLLAAFDILLMTTRFEGMPYAALEAMAAALPVVAVDVPGMAELVQHGVTGCLAPPDAEKLAAEVLALADNPARRQACGEAARDLVNQRFLLKDFINNLQDLYLSGSESRGRKNP